MGDPVRQATQVRTPAGWLRADAVARAAGTAALAIELVEAVGSTNEALLSRPIGAAALPPVLFAAREQTAGRGRRGRSWLSDPDRCLTFSLSLERHVGSRERVLAGFSLAVGVALAESLAPRVTDLRLKWPNDLLRGGRKVSGILVETRRLGSVERVVVGIGLNLQAPARFEDEIAQPIGGLFDDGAPLPAGEREQLLGEVVAGQLAMWRDFQAGGLASFVARWSRFDALAGHEVNIVEGGRTLMSGRADGIDDSGALRVCCDDGVRLANVGDVSARRVPGA